MSTTLTDTDRSLLNALVARLESAWNAGDGDAFAADFAEDADFVNVRGDHHRGRAEIAAGHTGIFRSIYAGSRVAYVADAARFVANDVALLHVRSLLRVPSGPLAGELRSRMSIVLTRTGGDRWEIAALHNTLVAATAPVAEALRNAAPVAVR